MLVGASGLFSFGLLFFAALLCMLIAFFRGKEKRSGAVVFACVALVSACRFVVGAATVSANDIRQLRPRLPLENVRLIGRIAGEARFHAYRSGDRGTWVFPVKCEGIKTADRWEQRRGRVEIRILGAPPDLELDYDERLLLSGALRRRSFPGGDPFELAVPSKGDWKRLSPPRCLFPMVWSQQLRENAAERLSAGIESRKSQLAVYKALLLGYRRAVPSEINARFARTGTMHVFAISGLHVGMVALFLVILLKAAGIPRDWWGVWLIPLLLLYVASTGMKSSALRALTMAGVFSLAPLFRRKPDIPVSVAFAAIVLLFCRPAHILSAGFIYSFTVVSFIVIAFAVVPARFVRAGQGGWRHVVGYVASLGITSLAAFIASAPLSALYFGQFSPVSLVGNMIVVPLVFCIVLCGWLSILIPFVSEIFNFSALFFIDLLLGSTGWLADLPGACLQVSAPALFAVLLWYAGWIGLLVHARSRYQRILSVSLILLALLDCFMF